MISDNHLFSGKQEVKIKCSNGFMHGNLTIPNELHALIIFAHGSGSSRYSSRNIYVADQLNKAGFATLLFDLLVEKEDINIENRFNISLLKERLLDVFIWSRTFSPVKNIPVGLFGASTGAAAAIEVAGDVDIQHRNEIFAVVSRGGRPDLANISSLESLEAPTLLIIGGNDSQVIELNNLAFKHMHCQKSIKIIPGATHLFEEIGALESVATLAVNWFMNNLQNSMNKNHHE